MAENTSLIKAFRVQLRVLGALFMWEVITRYGRDNLGFIWLFLEPMIFTVAITTLWSATKLAHSSSLPIAAFALTGYSSVLLWRNCANRCCDAIRGNKGLLYHRPVRVLDLLLTKIFLEIAGASISFIGLGALWISIGWAEPPDDALIVLGGWLMLALFGTALALIVGAVTSFSEIGERLWSPTAYILFPLSGAAFMVEWLSDDFREFILWFPMVHCVEMIRDGYFGTVVRTHYDMKFVALACLAMVAVGLSLVRAAARKLDFA